MRIIDITVPIHPSMPVWPGDDAVAIEPLRSQDEGHRANVCTIRMSLHVGTHVDAPMHFVAGGGTVDGLPLETLIGRALVVNLDTAGPISTQDMAGAGIPSEAARVLLKTRNSALWASQPETFSSEFAHLTDDAARWVVERGLRLIGIDYLSVEAAKGTGATHTALLEAGIVIVEGLDLSEVSPGWYDLYCLPLKVQGGDGAPARVVLISDEA